MARKKLEYEALMKATEKLLLEQGYGGFNFSILSSHLHIGRSTLYEYYQTKDELIADYMNNVMDSFTEELQSIAGLDDVKEQFILLIRLMIKYSHIHSIIQMIPLLQSKSEVVVNLKKKFAEEHLHILQHVKDIIEKGKREKIVKQEIPTDVLATIIFHTINDPVFLEMDKKVWADWIWEIIYHGMKPEK